MRTFIALFEYWSSNSPDSSGSAIAVEEEGTTAAVRWYRADPHWLTLAACAQNEEEALTKFRDCLMSLYQRDPRHEVLPSGAQVILSSLFDLTDLAKKAVVLDWSTIHVEEKEDAAFRGIMRMPTRTARSLQRPNPTESPSPSGNMRIKPFVIFPDLH